MIVRIHHDLDALELDEAWHGARILPESRGVCRRKDALGYLRIYSGSPRFNRRRDTRLLSPNRPLLAQRQTVRANHADDLAVLVSRYHPNRERPARPGPARAGGSDGTRTSGH
jgi:hypothetical protein